MLIGAFISTTLMLLARQAEPTTGASHFNEVIEEMPWRRSQTQQITSSRYSGHSSGHSSEAGRLECRDKFTCVSLQFRILDRSLNHR